MLKPGPGPRKESQGVDGSEGAQAHRKGKGMKGITVLREGWWAVFK